MTRFRRAVVPALALVAAGLAGLATAAPTPPVAPLQSVSVELPAGSSTFPPGPNVETISNNCVACHSAGMILNQPALKRAVWEGEVRKMISVYKAPVDEADVPAIVDYLAAVKGAK